MSENVKKGTRRGESSKRSNMFAGVAAARMSPNKQTENVAVEEKIEQLTQPERTEQQDKIDSNPDVKNETVENVSPAIVKDPAATNIPTKQSTNNTMEQGTVQESISEPAKQKEAIINPEEDIYNQNDAIKEITKKVERVYRERKKEKKKQEKSVAAYQTSIRIDKDLWDFIQSIVEESEDGAALSSNMVINCLIAMNKK